MSKPTDENQYAEIEHSKGGSTTKDATDLGVPMKPAEGPARSGPEDALSKEPTRGDYSGRTRGEGYQPHSGERVPDAKPGEAVVRSVKQKKEGPAV